MSKETAFSVFCLESYKAHKSLTGKQTAELFRRYGVFDYLNEFYDVLHTTGYQYINNDIDIYLKSRNAMTKEGKFMIFCAEQYKYAKKLTGRQLDEMFSKYRVWDYLYACYEALHTTSTNYIIHDIDLYIDARKPAMA